MNDGTIWICEKLSLEHKRTHTHTHSFFFVQCVRLKEMDIDNPSESLTYFIHNVSECLYHREKYFTAKRKRKMCFFFVSQPFKIARKRVSLASMLMYLYQIVTSLHCKKILCANMCIHNVCRQAWSPKQKSKISMTQPCLLQVAKISKWDTPLLIRGIVTVTAC